MRENGHKISIIIATALLFSLLCIGYAATNDDLYIFGNLSAEGQANTVLQEGALMQDDLATCEGVQIIIFDTYKNQTSAFQAAGFVWEEGEPVDEKQSGSIRLFYDRDSKVAYVLLQEGEKIYAGADASSMFKNLTTLETIWFNNFETNQTTRFDEMFAGCTSLETIYAVQDFSLASKETDENMFLNCVNLSGGRGTRVYPLGSNETTQPLNSDYAKIDAAGVPGYFTYTKQAKLVYFRSNLLREPSANVQYPVKGTYAKLTLSNALDSATFSGETVRYRIQYYVPEGDGWKLASGSFDRFSGGSYQTKEFTVTPLTLDGVAYNRVRVVADCLTGQMETLEAVFEFDTCPAAATYKLENGVVYMQLSTGSQSGSYSFSWASGVTADQSDPNRVFTGVAAGAQSHAATLNGWTVYEFCFFITDKALLASVESDPALLQTLVTFTAP